MKPYYDVDGITIYHGDCREILPELEPVDLVLTDPPYPSYLTKELRYSEDLILCLDELNCPQLVFWTPAKPFPLSYDAKRIWDKGVGTNTQYEEVYQRNSKSKGYKIHRHYRHNNALNASWCGDLSFEHPTQKPIRLMRELLCEFSTEGQTILDPFAGSGSTLRAAADSGRKAIGIEIKERYCEIAANRLAQKTLF